MWGPKTSAEHVDGPPSSRDAPPLRPPPLASIVRYKTGAPIDEVLYRLSVGDLPGVLDAAESLLDEDCVPILVLPHDVVRDLCLSAREELIVSLIDGHATLEEVIAAAELSLLEGLRTVCELLEKRIIALP